MNKNGNLENVKNYIQWYLGHLNWPDKNEINGQKLYGTIYDYYIDEEGREFSTNDYDSADSYAATFCSLIRTYCDSGGEVSFIKENENKINSIAKTMIRLMDKDGLTFAKPNYEIKFLMDNCEVYKGLEDISYVYEHFLLDNKKAKYYLENAELIMKSVKTNFLNNEEFYVYKDLKGYKKVDWNMWYPDSVSQVYPVLFGVINAADPRAQNLYKNVCKNWDWSNLRASKDYPWVLMGYVDSIFNYNEKNSLSEIFYNNINSRYLNEKISDNWNSQESAWYINLTNSLGKRKYLNFKNN